MSEDIQLKSSRLSPAKRALLERRLKGVAAASPKADDNRIPKRPDPRSAPLSFSQERLWFFQQIQPGSTVFNMPMTARLRGPLNLDALKKTINEIRRRHEVLRSAYSQTDGRMLQVIHEARDEELEIIDLSPLPPRERDQKARALTDEEAESPFNLGEGRFLRAKLLHLGRDDHLLLLTMHHIAFDGWSTGVLNRELELLYGAFSTGKPSPLPEPSVQYADYSIWLREQIKSDTIVRQVEYWKNCLRGAPALLELPMDRPRPAVQTYVGGSVSSNLDPELTRRLGDLGQAEGATLFMTFLAAFQLLLHRLSGQDDIVVGMPIAGRNRVEIEGLLGFFLNTLPLRTSLAGNISFVELLRRARATALGAFGNQDVPFDKLVEELHPERSLSHSPIFQVLLNMYDFQTDSLNLSNLQVELLNPSRTHSKFDLTLYIEQRRTGIEFQLVYNTALFDHSRMTELLRQFKNLLTQIAARPDARIDEFSLLTAEASRELPDPTRALGIGEETAMHERFTRQAAQDPDRIALSDRHGEWSYGELESFSNQIGHFLAREGVRKGDVVAVFGYRAAPLVGALLGILKSGGVFVVLDPAYPASRIMDSLQIARPRAWIQLEEAGTPAPELEACVARLGVPRLMLPGGKHPAHALADVPSGPPEARVGPDDAAYIAFTSGSSGKPKGVLGIHRPVSHFVHWHVATHGFNRSDRFAMLSGLAHDPLLRDIFTPLSIGASLHIPNLDNITSTDEVAYWMKDNEITVAHLTPAFGQLLASGERVVLPRLRYGFYGADVLTRRDVAILKRIAPAATCINFYGATETPQAIAFHPIDAGQSNGELGVAGQAQLEERIPLGRGIDGVQLLVLNRAGHLAGVGELGELCVRTPYLSRGYLQDETLTREKFVPNPFTLLDGDRMYRTGDLARYRPDGAVQFAGRADHQVKIRGFRVELRDVEMALRGLDAVREAAVTARQTASSDRQIIGYVAPKPGATINPHELRLQLKQRLPEYMIPTHFVPIEAVPLTPNGKIDYRLLPAPQELHPEREKGYVAPRDPVEELLAKIWAEVLGVEKVGIHDNFFDLGGHSLMCLQIINQLHKAGLWVTAPQFFQHPTIAELASVATTAPAIASDEDGGSSLVALRPRGTRPPLFLVHTAPGDVLGYINLVNLLGDDQPCYGFQSLGLQSLDRAHRTIPEMAAHYVKLLRRLQPEGPYYLAGWCFGGIVAMEMADQLIAQGQKLGILALFETWAHPPQEGKFQFVVNRLKCFMRMNFPRKLRYLKQKLRFYYAWYFNKKLVNKVIEERFGFSIAHGPLASREEVYRINLHASQTYPSRPFAGRITLFNAEEIGDERIPDLTGGFATLVREIDIHPVPGEHMSVLKEPHVTVLAEKLKDCLRLTHERLGVPPPPRPDPVLPAAPQPAALPDLELTANQQQVWVAQKLHPDTLYYHVAGIIRPSIAVNFEPFKRSIRTLVRSSDALRTILVERDGIPFRRVLPDIPFEIEHIDLSARANPEAELREWMQRRVARPFDLGVRMFDFALLKLSGHENAWYFAFHHLITDGWSIVMTERLISEYYRKALDGTLRDVEPMPTYEQHVTNEREFRATDRFRKNEAYWNTKLEGVEPIAFHGKITRRKSTRMRRITRELGTARVQKLRELTRDKGSLPNLFFTLLAVFIHRNSGQTKFLLGIPFHNRRNREAKETIGFFSEVLPLRVEIAPDESIASLASKLRSQTLETIRHGPFALQRRDRAPGHDAILNFLTTFVSEFAGKPAQGEWVNTGHGFEGLAVQVHHNDWETGLKLELDCHQDVFTAEQAEQAADQFLGLVDEYLQNQGEQVTPVLR